MPWPREEADTRVFVHAGDATSQSWQTWNVCEDVTGTFKKLSNCPQKVADDDLQKLENFVVLMYDRSSAASCVNEARLDLFARKQRTYDAIPVAYFLRNIMPKIIKIQLWLLEFQLKMSEILFMRHSL